MGLVLLRKRSLSGPKSNSPGVVTRGSLLPRRELSPILADEAAELGSCPRSGRMNLWDNGE